MGVMGPLTELPNKMTRDPSPRTLTAPQARSSLLTGDSRRRDPTQGQPSPGSPTLSPTLDHPPCHPAWITHPESPTLSPSLDHPS